jgi:hypothetical protein
VARGRVAGDQRKAWQQRAQNRYAPAAALGWTRHHDEEYSNKFIYLQIEFLVPRGRRRKTSLMDLKQLWLMTR